MRHPEFEVLHDPFTLIDEAWDSPTPSMFLAQLRISTERLHPDDSGPRFIAERGPLDFVAYLLALEELTVRSIEPDILDGAIATGRAAMAHVDLLVLLPLEACVIGPSS